MCPVDPVPSGHVPLAFIHFSSQAVWVIVTTNLSVRPCIEYAGYQRSYESIIDTCDGSSVGAKETKCRAQGSSPSNIRLNRTSDATEHTFDIFHGVAT